MKTIPQLTHKNKNKLKELEGLLQHEFSDPSLLQQALIHSSFGFEQLKEDKNNETLEFIGDAVLDLAVSDMLFHQYPGIREGDLTKMRANLVKESTLAKMARKIKLGDFLLLGKGEEASQGWKKASIMASTFEALVGAMYLDSGYEKTLQFISTHFKPLLSEKMTGIFAEDAKSQLQERLQEHFNRAPTYHLEAQEGPDHAKRFTVSVRFMEKNLGTGSGSSKKGAEQQAAEDALDNMESWWDEFQKDD
jgi:ribonuclease III